LHTEIAAKPKRSFKRQLRPFGFALRLAGCFLSVVLATVFVGLAPEADFIWVANGVLLAYLLLAPRRRWPAYICAAFAAQFTGGLFARHHGILSGLYLTLLNVAESLVSALLLRHRSSNLPNFTAPAYIARFLTFGCLPALFSRALSMLCYRRFGTSDLHSGILLLGESSSCNG
jgi:integral membrane sensor domain MASE1